MLLEMVTVPPVLARPPPWAPAVFPEMVLEFTMRVPGPFSTPIA